MKKHLLIMWSLLLCFATGAWAADGVSTLTFEDKCGGSGTANDGVKWTITSDGNESNYDANRGIHYGTSSAAVQYIRLTTSDITYPIKKIVVNASTANGVTATVSVTVGGEAFGGDAQTLTSDAADYEFTGSASGVIVVNVTKPASAKKALYVKSVAVTYEVPAGTPMAPTISGKDPFVGSTSVTITNNEDGATVYYTTDESDPTTSTTAQEYTAAFDISATTTVKAAAKKGDKWSAVASKTFTAIPSVANIAELTALGDEATFNFTGEALIVAQPSATNTYVKDNTGSTLIYGSNMVATGSVGKTIAAGWTGKVDFYNGLFEAKPDAALTLKEGEAVPVTYDEASIADLALANNINKVVVLKGVTYTLGTGKNFTINMEGAEVTGYNQFNLTIEAAEDGKTYDIVGAISRHNDDIQFQPISITKTPEVGSYEIKIVNTDGLTIKPDVTTAKAGDKVYASYVLADHYQLEFPDFVDDDGQPIEFTEGVTAGLEEVGGEMKMWFIMPEKNVTIKAKATKLYQLSMTQPENGTITVISVNMGSDPYSKAGKTICMMVTANEGYVIKSVEVKDANDAAVAVSPEDGIEYGQTYNYVFTMPASDVKIGATIQKKPEDININPETGADISQALATASEGKNVRNITINLNAGEYTMSAPIVAGGNIIIDGAEGAKIDASAVSGPLFQYVAPVATRIAPATRRAPATPVDGYTYIDEVSIKNVEITGIKGSVYWDGNVKVCIENFAIENAVLGLATESSSLKDNTIVSFQGGSAKDFTVKNSTIYGNAVAKYFNKASSNDAVKAGYDEVKVTYENNTFYKVLTSNGEWGNNLRYNNNKAKVVATINNNIWVDNGNGQIMRRLFNTPFSGLKAGSAMANNLFQVNDAVVDQSTYGNGSDINGIVTFTDAPQGNFGGSVTLVAWDAEEPASLGDSRWTITYENPNVLWSSAEAVACNWASEIAIASDKLANLKVGDKIHVAVEGVTPGTDWSAQVAIYAGNGSGLEEGVPVGAGDKNDAVFTVTGDIKRLIQANGLSVTGNGFSSKKVTLEPAAEALGSDNSIFVGSYSQQLTLNKNHFINANDGAGIAAGDKLVVTCTAIDPAPGDVWFNLCDGNWTQIVDGAEITDTVIGKVYVFTADVATTAMSSSLILNQQGYTITQVELIPAPVEHTYIVAGSNSDIFGTPWDPTNESNKMTNNGDGTYSKTYTVSEAVNDIQLKVVEDGTTWYGDAEGQNVVFDLSAAGSFTVNFDPATGIVTVTGDIVTGINAISADKAAENLENAEIYTLNGQRVEKPRKGLYIVNGKKVVIK